MTIAASALTLGAMLQQLRTNLMDTTGPYRWDDPTLKRQIDRALEKYSYVSPAWQTTQIPTVAGSTLYPAPYNCWWIEKVEYPLGYWPRSYQTYIEKLSPLIQNPASNPMVAGGSGASTAGSWNYACTFTTPGGGETLTSPQITTATLYSTGILSHIPLGPYGVTGRNIYRTKNGAGTPYLAGSIPDNTTTTFLDTMSDAALGTQSTAPAANTTQGIPIFELDLSPAQTPQDASGWIEILAAYKHELDNAGTTVPEKHWDCIVTGSMAYALEAYLVSTNDNFDYVDGQFRDRVDDTAAPAAWAAQAKTLMQRFDARLEEIKHEANALTVRFPNWGDKPLRWNRL